MTIKQIAEIAGVSISTVSKVVNGHDSHISDATRNRVRKVVEENNYITNAIARGLKTKKTNIIGFILPDIANPYYPEIARGIEDAARERGFGVVYCNTDNDLQRESDCLDFLKSKMVDGIIYTRTLKDSDAQKISSLNIPIVIVDRFVKLPSKFNYGQVYVDVQKAIYESTLKMADKGCRRICFISSSYNENNDRYFGYINALKHLGIEYDNKLVYLDQYTIETGYLGLKALLRKNNDIDSVVCGNDLIAIGVLDALRDLNISVPKDIKVIGLDNIYLSHFTNPRLSTMAQPTHMIGMVAADMLIDYLDDHIPLTQKKLDYTYIERETL